MLDQATRLREIATELQADEEEQYLPDNRKKTRACVYAVTSGKGGVGKSYIAVNLAITMRNLDRKVLLLDADINLANADILMGQIPQRTIADAIIKDYPVKEVIYSGPNDIHILPGGSGFSELSDLSAVKQTRILRQLENIEYNYDYIIVDTPAGIHKNVLDFVMYASHAIVIATPEPTSIADAYAMIKLLTLSQNTGRVYVLFNMVKDYEQAKDLFLKIKLVAERFLQVKLFFMGYVIQDKMIPRATIMQKPFVSQFPNSPASLCINTIAERIVLQSNLKMVEPNGSFFKRLAKFSIFQ